MWKNYEKIAKLVNGKLITRHELYTILGTWGREAQPVRVSVRTANEKGFAFDATGYIFRIGAVDDDWKDAIQIVDEAAAFGRAKAMATSVHINVNGGHFIYGLDEGEEPWDEWMIYRRAAILKTA